MKKILLSVLISLLLICTLAPCLPISAEQGSEDVPDIEGVTSYYFYNMTSDKLIASQNANMQISTSTSAKVMMGMLLCEKLELRLNETVQITEEMISGVTGRKYGYKAGDSATIKDILYSAICASHNDSAYIAVNVAYGSVDEFVSLMNSRAAEYGASMTHYTNPLGFPVDKSMVTTASDVAKIARHAYANTLYMEIASARHYTMNDKEKKTVLNNYNLLVCSSTNADYYGKYYSGMNAGCTSSENWSVVTVASDDDQKYLCVILGGSESENGKIYAYTAANKLVRWAFNEYKTYISVKKGYVAGHIPVNLTGMAKSTAPYVASEDLKIYIPKDALYNETLLSAKVELFSDSVNAPVSAGQTVGILRVYYDGEFAGKCELIIEDDYEPNLILLVENAILEYITGRAFIITLISCAVLIPTAILIIRSRSRRKAYKKFKK